MNKKLLREYVRHILNENRHVPEIAASGADQMKNSKLLRAWIQTSLKKGTLTEAKSLAGFNDPDANSPFAGKANGQMSFLAEWAVYFAANNPGNTLTDEEWDEAKKDKTAIDAVNAAEKLAGLTPIPNTASANLVRVREILTTMKTLAAEQFVSLKKQGLDITPKSGKGSAPKPGTDLVDVELKALDVHVKLNDDKRIGGLQRASVSKGEFLSGNISTDIYYQAIESLLNKYVLDEKTADPKYRKSLVDVTDEKTGLKRDFVSTKASAASNIHLGVTTITMRVENGRPILDKRGIPQFDSPKFKMSSKVKAAMPGIESTELWNQSFTDLWNQSTMSGPHMHLPDPAKNNPQRTAHGIKFIGAENPSGDYIKITAKGAKAILEEFEIRGTPYILEFNHHMKSRAGTMSKPVSGKDRASGSKEITNKSYADARSAYNQLFVDKHDEFISLLDSMGYTEALIPDVSRRVFGVDDPAETENPAAYFKFGVNWPTADKVSLTVTAYPGIPKMTAKPQELRDGKYRPSKHFKIYGQGALKNDELFTVAFRNFDGSHPPQINLGKNGDVLTSKVIELPNSSGDVRWSDVIDPIEKDRELKRSTLDRHPAVSYLQDLQGGKIRSKIMEAFLKDQNIVIQKDIAIAPVSRQDIFDWVSKNYKSYKAYLPTGNEGIQNDAEGKTWIWAMIAQGLEDINAPLTEDVMPALNRLIKEEMIKRILLEETSKDNTTVI